MSEAQAYKVPEKFSSMTIHHLYGITGRNHLPLMSWFARYRFALLADLKMSEFSNQEIETAVSQDQLKVANWPKEKPLTNFFWIELDGADDQLQGLGNKAVELCFGQTENQPVGGDFASVGATIGSQQLAIAGLIYAREHGKLREINLDGPAGPLYVARGSYSDKMFSILLPED